MRGKIIIISVLGILTLGLFAFQKEDTSKNKSEDKLTIEEAIELALQKKINSFQLEYRNDCEEKALSKAVVIADSLIAEMYAQDLRAKDQILKRPEKPAMPSVEINPFPFDSIE